MLVFRCVLGFSALAVLALDIGDLFSDIPTPVHSHTATTSILSRYSTEQPQPITLTTTTTSSSSSAVKTTSTSASTVLPTPVESNIIDHSSKTWQIVGIAIIAVLFVATSITCAMFFDRLWTFLKDVVCCAARPLDSEQFIPDCEKQCCDTRSLSTVPSDPILCRAELLREEPAFRARELPWSTDCHDWNSLRRQPSRRNDQAPAT